MCSSDALSELGKAGEATGKKGLDRQGTKGKSKRGM